MICLQDICLSLIADEFERFHFAFCRTNDVDLKRNFEFLQRRYSFELGLALSARKKVEDEYLEFLFNEHLKMFNETILFRRNNRFCNNPFYHCYKEYLFSRLPNLTKIFCYDVSDEILQNISKFCPKIVEIGGLKSSATDPGINYLCKKNENGSFPCPKLKILFIRRSRVTYEGVERLVRNLKSLERLDYENIPAALYSLHKDDLPKLENVPTYSLVELKLPLDGHFVSRTLPHNDLLKICLTVCRKLRSLTCDLTDKEQLCILNNTSLQHLNISFTHKKINIDSFLKNCGSKLFSLNAYNCTMTISNLAISCPRLKHLVVQYANLSNKHSDSKVVFHCLVAFSFFSHEYESEKAINLLLSSSPILERISFISCDIFPNITCILKCCEKKRIKWISFMNCINVEMDFVKDIFLSCPSLKGLAILNVPFAERHKLKKDDLIQFVETLENKPQFAMC